jgi:hypothetical protein
MGGNVGDPQTLNGYSYVRDNPVNLVDPSGMCGQDTGFHVYVCIEDWGLGGGDGGGDVGGFPLNCQASPACLKGWRANLDKVGKPVQAPQPLTAKKPPSRLACAADYGQNHSIAAWFGAQNSFVGNLFGGNSVSGAIDLGRAIFGSATPSGSSIATTILSGGTQGLPVPAGHPGLDGAVGQVQNAGIQAAYGAVKGVGQETLELGISASGNIASVAAPLTETALFGIGVAKLAFDAVTVGYGYIAACHQ